MRAYVGVLLAFALTACAVPAAPAVVSTPAPAPAPVIPESPAPQAVSLGECLAKRGATVYLNCYFGASHRQLVVLGADARQVRRVACLTCMETYGTNEECHTNAIHDYPTWIFADGTRLIGEQDRDALARAAGCDASVPSQ